MSYARPVCGAALDPVSRYPRYVCANCASKAAAVDGRRLQFSNIGLSCGFEARYADTGETYASHVCLDRRHCLPRRRSAFQWHPYRGEAVRGQRR